MHSALDESALCLVAYRPARRRVAVRSNSLDRRGRRHGPRTGGSDPAQGRGQPYHGGGIVLDASPAAAADGSVVPCLLGSCAVAGGDVISGTVVCVDGEGSGRSDVDGRVIAGSVGTVTGGRVTGGSVGTVTGGRVTGGSVGTVTSVAEG